MFSKLRDTYNNYPRQFWLMFVGMLISTTGTSMIWPFLMVYVSERLDSPLSAIASLLTLNSIMGLIASFIGGPVIDRTGRKWVMVGSLATNGLAYLFMSQAHTLGQFALLMSITGAVNPLYRTGADAMMADLVPAEKRIDAYALLRLSTNLGISIGPAIGGFVTSSSFSLAFLFATIGMVTFSLLLTFFARETLPSKQPGYQNFSPSLPKEKEKLGGYAEIIKDKLFIGFIIAFTMVSVCATLIWVLLPIQATQTYQVPKQLYGFIPTTNAVMVVTLQLFVTKFTKRYPPLPIAALGALFYAIAVGAVAFMNGFWGFWLCMVIMTIGEIIIVPTSSTYVANLAPPDKRGRYMSLFALTWGAAAGVGPLFGGILNDTIGPSAIWLGGAVVGFLGMAFFLFLDKKTRGLSPSQAIHAA